MVEATVESPGLDLDEEDLAGAGEAEVEAPPVPNPYVADLERVEALVEQASDDTRDGEQRIADLEEALRLLQGIAASAPEADRPVDLDRRITAVEQALERLRLGEFFAPES